jgi:DNA-binding LacI/PurR family transcriptional regulator
MIEYAKKTGGIMPTIKDVAKRANISVSAVSKAFNNYNEIPVATKERIFNAARELDYIPNKAAMQLSRGEFPYVGLIVKELTTHTTQDEHTFRLLGGVHSRLSETGHEMVLFTTEQIKKMNLSYVDFCRYHSLLGAVIHGLDMNDPYLEALLSSRIPCVLIDIELEGPNTAFISTDNVRAAAEVIDLLCEKGRTRLCHILGGETADVTKHRKKGVLQAAEKNNIPAPLMVAGDFQERIAYEGIKKVLSEHGDISGIFAASDLMALGAMRAIYEAERIPGIDIALVGFDGLKALEYTQPPVATVFQDFHSMGRLAVDTLLDISKGKKFNAKNYVKHEIIRRGTV